MITILTKIILIMFFVINEQPKFEASFMVMEKMAQMSELNTWSKRSVKIS